VALPQLGTKSFQIARDLLSLIYQSAISARVISNF
jgi:hypothetical protein